MSEEDAFPIIGEWTGFDDYRGALTILFNDNDRVLLQLRDDLTTVEPDKWGLFGGGVEAGETLVEAASRELAEELGVAIPQADLNPLARLVTQATGKRLYCYTAKVNFPLSEITLGEGAGFGLFTADAASHLPLVSATRRFLEFWQKSKTRTADP